MPTKPTRPMLRTWATRHTERRSLGWVAPVALFVLVSLSLSSVLHADTFTVGASGDFSGIQQAIDAAAAAGGVHEVRVEKGVYVETLTIDRLEAGDELELSGGWNSQFAQRSQEPSETTVDANGAGRVLQLGVLSAGTVKVENFTFTGGLGSRLGGGVFVDARGSAEVEFLRNRVVDNEIVGEIEASGAGLYLRTFDQGRALVSLNTIAGNRALAVEDAPALGGGALLLASHVSRVTFVDNQVRDNLARALGSRVRGAGVFAAAAQSAALSLEGNQVVANTAHVALNTGCSSGLRIETRTGSTATLIARRNTVFDNSSVDTPCVQVDLFASDGPVVFTDSLIAKGSSGLHVLAIGAATVSLTNLTVTDHAIREIFVTGGNDDAVVLSNTVAFGSESLRLNREIRQTNNLIGTDPLFVHAAAGDLRLRPGSPALNAGNNSPPGGLGPRDVDGKARVQGQAVDIGAHESDAGTPLECLAGGSVLCLDGGRFRVEVDWRTADQSGMGQDVGLGSDDSGLFYFFNSSNWEMLVKVLDGCGINNRYWVFAAATTDVEYTLRVTDTQSGQEFLYTNPLGRQALALTDTGAFATCP